MLCALGQSRVPLARMKATVPRLIAACFLCLAVFAGLALIVRHVRRR